MRAMSQTPALSGPRWQSGRYRRPRDPEVWHEDRSHSGTGLIGSQVVKLLNEEEHEAVPHSPSTGVDLLSGDGLAAALDGADAVVNLTNSPTFDEASPAFFQTSMDNLIAAAAAAGVGHAVILSIVGVEKVPDFVYYRAKVLQEDLLKAGPVPYSIVRSTQFYEFLDAVLSQSSDDNTVRLPTTKVQPIASADIARAVADVTVGAPLNGTRNVAGPEVFTLDELGRITLEDRIASKTATPLVSMKPTRSRSALIRGGGSRSSSASNARLSRVDVAMSTSPETRTTVPSGPSSAISTSRFSASIRDPALRHAQCASRARFAPYRRERTVRRLTRTV
jgi:uncharacterized protein YbjT (DUF2867 family)